MNIFQSLQSGLIAQIFYNKLVEQPTGIYFGLSYGAPSNQNYYEVLNASNNYVRVPGGVTNGTGVQNWNFYWPYSGIVFNNNQITWPVANVGWGVISGVCIFDSAVYSGGNCLFYGNLGAPVTLLANQQMYIPVSGVSVQLI